jgi:hypothetical protein
LVGTVKDQFKRDQVLDFLAETDEITDTQFSENEEGLDDTEEEEDDEEDDRLKEAEAALVPENALIPCAAHLLNLVVQDGLKLDSDYSDLLSKVRRLCFESILKKFAIDNQP